MAKSRRMKDWMETRLRDLPGRKNKAGVAAALGVAAARVSEIIKGKRQIQEHEWEPLAKYLNWTVQELHDAARRIPRSGEMSVRNRTQPLLGSSVRPPQVVERIPPLASAADRVVPVREAKESSGVGAFVISQRIIEEYNSPGQGDRSFSFYCTTDDAHPYERGDRLLINPDLPLQTGKHAVFLTEPKEDGTQEGLIGLLTGITSTEWTYQGYKAKGGALHPYTATLSRRDWPNCHRIVGVRHR